MKGEKMVDKEAIDEAINMAWSDYCDLDHWIDDLTRGEEARFTSKYVLKMAMKHLRDDFYKLYKWACVVKEENKDETKDESI